ncbi:hypothetical protein FC093_05345 [Ilyomonas limi]|uniref:Uncharacterized protein n=1 Tax=Ilyomonas limi TaxID=2575867 RepID=A0A4U3L4X3_9BACT|nr:hypothetical protein [Ilyomonas limi]TKK70175.1 hypothetical protein FC093_05345 [Ilyomonas limi]
MQTVIQSLKKIIYLFIILICISCHQNNTDNGKEATRSIPAERPNPDPKPVATYSQDITSEMGRLNHWKFAVAMYETHQTFMYRVQIQYAELNVTDSLQLPNLGFMPKPALQKGKDDYSCVIGFLDDKGVFRDYKLVSVANGNVRIHTLKYYSVQPGTAQ